MLAESMDQAMQGHRDRPTALVCVPEHIPAVVSADRLSDHRYFANTIRIPAPLGFAAAAAGSAFRAVSPAAARAKGKTTRTTRTANRIRGTNLFAIAMLLLVETSTRLRRPGDG